MKIGLVRPASGIAGIWAPSLDAGAVVGRIGNPCGR